jgi:ABC-type dipeptide/oligopeptide/nickel transport system ATPase component
VRRIADRVLVMLRGRIIERFSIGELGLIEHHPYTQKLLAAAQLGDRTLEHDTASIEDLAPSEEGCAYASLCPLARAKGLTERCRGERPPLTFTSPQRQSVEAHAVACFALTEGSKHKEEQFL